MLYKYSLASVELTEENEIVIVFESPFPDIEADASCKCADLAKCRFHNGQRATRN